MKQWGAPESEDVHSQLLSAYSEPHRHYHTVEHIDNCLAQLDEARSIAREPAEVELALWFHDAVYKPTSSENEAQSAAWAQSFLRAFGAADERCDRVVRYILATKHDTASLSGDAAVVVDIDLSILGRRPEEYDRYERAIRKEYKWVPRPVYRRKRVEILESFLSRAAIYRTEHFRSRYEQQARLNLQRAIEELQTQP
jgi:predicted metal-dependent HD superfamily phosphohydrolase